MTIEHAYRVFMGDSLGFHIIFALFGVGLPVLVSLAELYSIVKKNEKARDTAKVWTKIMVVLALSGVVSGTIISMQFSTMWPAFMDFAGEVIGLPFVLEGYAFTLEAIFLAVYVISWDKLKPWAHWLCSLPIIIGAVGSAFFITTVNSFMQSPQGFTLQDGKPVNIEPFTAMFNPATFTMVTHSIMGYLTVVAAAFLAAYAFMVWRNKKPGSRSHYLRVMDKLAILVVIFGAITVILGDASAKHVAKHQPAKLAAMEVHYETQRNAPLQVGGILKDGHLVGSIEIPGALSFLATGSFNGEVKGLNEFAVKERPPLYIHYLFMFKVIMGPLIVALAAGYLAARRWRKNWAENKYLLMALSTTGIIGVLIVEAGWMLAEIGRQPYIIYGVMRTADAAGDSKAIFTFGPLFPLAFIVLFIVTAFALRWQLKPAPKKGDKQ